VLKLQGNVGKRSFPLCSKGGWRFPLLGDPERSHAGQRRRYTVPTVMHYCLAIGQFVKNQIMLVQFSSVTSLLRALKSPHLFFYNLSIV